MITLPFKLPPRSKPFIITLSVAIFLVAVGAGGAYYISHNRLQPAPSSSTTDQQQATSSTGATVSQTVQITSTPTPTPTPTTLITDSAGITTFSGLGIEFTLGDSDGNNAHGNRINVINNTVYVGHIDSSGKSQEYVQVFTKPTTDSLQAAITKQVLSGYNSSDCPISVSTQKSTSYQVAHMSYATSNRFANGEGPADPSKCPSTYAVPGDIRYFLLDPNHPSTFVFVSAGQSPVDNQPDGKVWDQTITFTN